ncbi:5,6-dimethylbenzimidazole synthase [Microvirga sp. GCM10011540]|uniref:5,6-dimethylbenzimidazole synthase n=1 Tax=Microvirga sp. GCM10011540 TaxID=3317338 RepID=UPI00367303D3
MGENLAEAGLVDVCDPGAPREVPSFDDGFRVRLKDLLVWRRHVRRFRPDPLPDSLLERLIDLACLAPTVGLSQPWRFVVVNSVARRAAIRTNFERCNAEALASQPMERAARYARLKLAGLDEAPCHVAVFADRSTVRGHGLGRRTMPETVGYSAVMAIYSLWLLARAEGVGLGWVSILDPKEVVAALDVPQAWTFIGYLCLGYPDSEQDVPALERAGWEQRGMPSVCRLER